MKSNESEILKLTRNIYETYKTAPFWLKRQYLGLFWDKFLVQDKQIQQAVPTDLILRLQPDFAKATTGKEESKVLMEHIIGDSPQRRRRSNPYLLRRFFLELFSKI